MWQLREWEMASPKDTEAYKAKIRYLASAFVDAESIAPSARHMTALLDAMNDDELIPIGVQEETSTGPVPRIAFTTSDRSTLFALSGRRFDYSRLSLEPEGSDLGEFGEFCLSAS